MSELVRDIIKEKPITVRIYDSTFDDYMEQLILIKNELNAIGVNINQVTHFFHASAPQDNKRTYHALKISEQYKVVGMKVDHLNNIIERLSKKWLQN